MTDNPLPVNFTLSEAAKAEIDRLRSIWPQLANEEPGYLSIAWGEVYFDNGGQSGIVLVNFYPRNDDDELRPFIQTVSGVEFIFFTTMQHWWRFSDKVLDHSPEKSFHLR